MRKGRRRSVGNGLRGLLAASCLLAVIPAPVPADAVDDYVEASRVERRIPGLALLVIHDGRVVKAKGYGQANVEHEAPVTAETVFQLGSIGKQFTAAAVMMLVEDGQLGLDDSIRKFFPQAPEAWQAITVGQLLSHTSGLGGLPEGFDLTCDYTDDELLQVIFASPLAFHPGDDFQYSNLGYVTLGILIQKVTGKHYGDLLHERIFKPYGMSATRIISEADIVPHRAAGYRLQNGELKNQHWVSPTLNTTADGSLYSNVNDLARWDAALSEGRILKRQTLEQMWTPVKLQSGNANSANYGLGWFCEEIPGHRVIRHGGAWQGFTAHLARFLEDKLTVGMLANLSSDSFEGLAEMNLRVAAMYVPDLLQDAKKD